MSEADKKFEELGYEKIVEHKFKEPDDYNDDYNEGVTELILYRNEIKRLEISFWNDRTISKSNNYDVSYLTMQELQAINEKCKEMKWIE